MRLERNLTRRLGHAALTALALSAACGDDDRASDDPTVQAMSVEEAFPGRSGPIQSGVFQTMHGPEELRYELIDGIAVHQGDIILPLDGPDYRTGIASNLLLQWPHGIVRFENTGLFNDPRVTGAIKHWQDRTRLRFVGGATSGPRLKFVNTGVSGGCSSQVGRVGGAQAVNLGGGCLIGAAIHELGHAIGLYHEMSRSDRDNFLTINWNCILPGKEFNFDKYGSSGRDVNLYDYGSIMHYNSVTSFVNTSVPGCTATHTKKNGALITGSRTALDAFDIMGANTLYLTWTAPRRGVDYTGDGRADYVTWRIGKFIERELNVFGIPFEDETSVGTFTGIPVPGYYAGGGNAKFAVWEPADGTWYRKGMPNVQWGMRGDVPVPADYDGDGKTDIAVWRPDEEGSVWHVLQSSNGAATATEWGQLSSRPMPGDYDGDRKADLAVWSWSTGNWSIRKSSNGSQTTTQWGLSGDIPVSGDFDGDGKDDVAVWRPSDGTWYIINSSTGAGIAIQWGLSTDVPVPADFDGDGKTDPTIFRPGNEEWWTLLSRSGVVEVVDFGDSEDVPLP